MQEMRAAGTLRHALVVVGRYGWKAGSTAERLRQAEEEGWVAWLDEGVSDNDLAGIYESASCVIQASRAEGFGLPVAEAGHHGKPVVLSDIPVFREIVASDGYFFTLDDRASFAAALHLALQPGAPPTKSTAVSWRQSAELFWAECAKILA
jgi:glycosyltransferase involved in cell wall biosynthesis